MNPQRPATAEPRESSKAVTSLLIRGHGEMAELFASFDWEATPLGATHTWSETLIGAVNSMLNSPFASVIFWGPRFLLLYNDGYRTFLGGKHPAALGRPAIDSWEEVWDTVGPQLEETLRTGAIFNVKNILIPIRMDGRMEDRHWTFCFFPIYERGEIAGVHQIAFDATSEVLAQRALVESEARATRILQSIGDAVIVTDADARVMRMNPVAEGLTGWVAEEAKGRPLIEIFRIVNETSRKPVESPADKVRRKGVIVGMANHTLLIRRDGTETPIDDSGAPILDDDGELTGIVLIFRDITERRAAERALLQSEDRVRLAMAAANGVGTWDWDVVADRVYADANFAKLYGVDPEQAKHGVSISEFSRTIHPADRERVEEQISDAVHAGSQFSSEYRLVQPDGSVRWVLAVGRCTHTADKTPLRFPGVTVDITDSRMQREALRLSETRFRVALETAQLGAWEIDLDTLRVECSEIFKANYGRRPEETLSTTELFDTVHPEDRAEVQRTVHDAVEHGTVFRAEYRLVWPDGSVHWVVSSGRLVDGESRRLAGVMLDVTDRHLAATALLQSEKLAAVGRLAASIAHEINNPLESVTNLLYLARGSIDAVEVQEYLDLAERELRRVSAISNQTLRFHKQSTSPRLVTAGEILENVLSVYQGRLANVPAVVERRERAARPLLCFDGEIRQVLNNLVGNAIDAMLPAGGHLRIRSREGTRWSTGEKGIVLTVADTGTGMTPEVMRNIFEPFFTTKGIGGNGLGLWVSQEIVTRHQGILRVRSSQRRGANGTVFALFLPFISPSEMTSAL